MAPRPHPGPLPLLAAVLNQERNTQTSGVLRLFRNMRSAPGNEAAWQGSRRLQRCCLSGSGFPWPACQAPVKGRKCSDCPSPTQPWGLEVPGAWRHIWAHQGFTSVNSLDFVPSLVSNCLYMLYSKMYDMCNFTLFKKSNPLNLKALEEVNSSNFPKG